MSGADYIVLRITSFDPRFAQYRNCVLAKWLKANKYGSPFFSLIDSRAYFATYTKVIQNILERPGTIIRVAVFADEEDTVLGWSVAENKTLHFLYVNPEVRKQGIGTALMPYDIDTITHMTKIGQSLWKQKFKYLKFNPF